MSKQPAVISFMPRAEWVKRLAREIVAEVRSSEVDDVAILRVERMLIGDDEEIRAEGIEK